MKKLRVIDDVPRRVTLCPDCGGPPTLRPGLLHQCATCGGWGVLTSGTRWPPIDERADSERDA